MAFRLGLQLLKSGTSRQADLRAQVAAIIALLSDQEDEPEPEPPERMPHGHVPTRVTDDDRIWTPFGTPSKVVSDAIMRGWPREIWTDAARVAYLEANHWDSHAERNTLAQANGRCNVQIGYIRGVPIVSEDSVGLFQVNVCAWDYTREQMLEPVENARAGYRIYRAQGWGAWRFTADTLGLL